MTQLELELAPLAEPDYTPAMSLDARFAAFHLANPHVARALEVLAVRWFAAGNTKCSAKQLVERLRWEVGVTTEQDGSGYRLNNSYVSRYARLLIDRHPEWADAFSLRALKTERAA